MQQAPAITKKQNSEAFRLLQEMQACGIKGKAGTFPDLLKPAQGWLPTLQDLLFRFPATICTFRLPGTVEGKRVCLPWLMITLKETQVGIE